MCLTDGNFLYDDSMKDSKVGHRRRAWLFADDSKSDRGRVRSYFLLGVNRTTKCWN